MLIYLLSSDPIAKQFEIRMNCDSAPAMPPLAQSQRTLIYYHINIIIMYLLLPVKLCRYSKCKNYLHFEYLVSSDR